MKKYEGLFILDVVGKEDAEKEIIDRIQKDIEQVGAEPRHQIDLILGKLLLPQFGQEFLLKLG